MITSTLKTWIGSLKALVTNVRALVIFVALYALLLVSFYFFISTREATVWQVLVTYLLLILVPAQFFIFQAAVLNYARDSAFVWKRILRDTLKIVAVTIPVLLLFWLFWALLNKFQMWYPLPSAPSALTPGPPKPQPIHWPTLIFATIRFLLFGVALPLATIHLWIEVTARELPGSIAAGVKAFGKRIGPALARAFSTESVFAFGLGLVFFVFIPYAVLFVPWTINGTKTAFVVFVVRLILAFGFALAGWIVTLVTLVRMSDVTDETAVVATPAPAEAAA